MTLVSCIIGLVIGVGLVSLMLTLLSENTASAEAQPPLETGSYDIVSCGPVSRSFENGIDTWLCNMIVGPDGYIWFVAVNNNLQDTFEVDNVINVLWGFRLEKSN